MPRNRRPEKARIGVESLEGRMLLSVAAAHPAASRSVHVRAFDASSPGASAILSAMKGGIGAEWATLIRREVRNPMAVASAFASGRVGGLDAPGLTFRNAPSSRPGFTGQVYDQLVPAAAGASVFKGNVLELAAILRGPFHDPSPTQYVFALDRGAGARLGPSFAPVPGITPDVLVTIDVGAFGSSASGTIADLAAGTSRAVDASQISIRGATLRVFLDANQFPSQGVPVARYRFAMWAQAQPGSDLANVAGFADASQMVPIAVAKTIPVRR